MAEKKPIATEERNGNETRVALSGEFLGVSVAINAQTGAMTFCSGRHAEKLVIETAASVVTVDAINCPDITRK